MKSENKWRILILVFFSVLTVFLFRNYFFKQKVPVPANLLVSLYSPYKFESWQGYERGVPNKPIGFDIVRQYYPYIKFTVDQIKSGRIPLWDPYILSGNVHLATYQTAIFYPFNFLYFIFPLADAWSLLLIIQPVLAGLFMFLFLRALSLSKRSSFFGALTFMLCGWMVVQWVETPVVEHSFLWLPFALYASQLIWTKNKLAAGTFLLFISLTMSMLAGYLQISIYVFIITIFWNLYQFWQSKDACRKTNIIFVLSALTLSLIVSSVQWLPAALMYQLAPRSSTNGKFVFESFLVPLRHILTLLVPDFWGNPGAYNYFFGRGTYQDKIIYIGIVPIIFALAAIFYKIKKNINFWKILGLISLSLGFAIPTSWIIYYSGIPVLSSANPQRIFAVSAFVLCVLSAYGLEFFLETGKWKKLSILLWISGLIIFCMGIFTYIAQIIVNKPILFTDACRKLSLIKSGCLNFGNLFSLETWINYAVISSRNLIIPLLFVIALWILVMFSGHLKRKTYFVVLLMTLLGGVYFVNKYLYFSERKFLYPELPVISKLREISGIYRVWGYGNAYFEPNILSYFGISSAEGYDSLFSRRYGELLSVIPNNGKIAAEIPRSDAVLSALDDYTPIFQNSYRRKLFSLLGVKYIAETKIKDIRLNQQLFKFTAPDFKLIWEDEKWRIWEYQGVLPRAFIADSFVVIKDQQKIFDTMFDNATDLGHTVVLEEEPKIELNTMLNPACKANISKYEASEVNIDSTCAGAGMLVLTDNFLPGWIAEVDGMQTKIYRADYTFRAVILPSGQHSVIFKYQPPAVNIGYWLFAGGVILLLPALILISNKFQKQRSKS